MLKYAHKVHRLKFKVKKNTYLCTRFKKAGPFVYRLGREIFIL